MTFTIMQNSECVHSQELIAYEVDNDIDRDIARRVIEAVGSCLYKIGNLKQGYYDAFVTEGKHLVDNFTLVA